LTINFVAQPFAMSISFPEQLVKCRLCWRITLAVFALIFIVESVLLIPSAQRFKQVEIERLATRTQSTVDAALMLGQGLSGGGPLARDLATLVGDGRLNGLLVTTADGGEVARAGGIPHAVASGTPGTPAVATTSPAIVSLPADVLSISWLSPGRGDLILTAFVDTSYLDQELLHYLLRIGGLILVIVFVVTGGTMIVLYRALLKPMLQLRESAIAAGETPKDAVKSMLPEASRRKRDELGDLIEAHNRLLSRVSESMQREARQAEEREYFLARHDAITGLPNRVALMEFLDNAARYNLPSQTSMALFLIQLSMLNERSEDCLLATHLPKKIDQQWEWLEEKYAFIAQLGPQSIVAVRHIKTAPMQALTPSLVQINSQAPRDSASIAEHILRAGSAHAPLCEMRIGIVESGSVETSPALLLSHAEFALNRVRADPAARYQFFDQTSADEASERQRITRELSRALIEHELVVWFQPKVSLQSTTQLTGMEALVRWQHPTRGVLSPAEFVPLAEATGLIEALDRYVFAAVCRQIRQWREQGFALPRVAVNLAARTFESACLADDLRLAIEAARISPRDIEIEITETAAMKNVTQTAATLSATRALGMRTAIDDFGTGYSSLSYLRSFQIDTLKIDRSFVNDIGRNPNVEAICGVIAQLGRAIGAHVVAEGVETDAEAAYLRAQGCDDAQGYLFGRPLPAAEFATRWLVASDNIVDENFISARAA
jgi:EAL domain-containing protein (putative c-di-GMP-specific phosphodiesterase class I)